MVLRVCRANLGHSKGLEDAFQTTFLLLVERADTLRVRDTLGPWLHAVACRVARQARRSHLQQERHEQQAALCLPRDALGSFESFEAEESRRLLHEELKCLSYRYRAPLVLCYLEGFGVQTTMFMTKLKAVAAGLFLLAIAGAGAVALAPQDAAPRPGASNDQAPEIRASGDAVPKGGVTRVIRPAGGDHADPLVGRLDVPTTHEIVVTPGSTVLIRIETKEGNLIDCAATMQSDGRLNVRQHNLDRGSGAHIDTEKAATSIVISPTRPRSQPTGTGAPAASGAQRLGLDMVVPRDASDHERRLSELEQKLDRVVRLLERRPAVQGLPKGAGAPELPMP